MGEKPGPIDLLRGGEPSSMTQSLRSIDDSLLARSDDVGGDGDLDSESALGAAAGGEGVIGK